MLLLLEALNNEDEVLTREDVARNGLHKVLEKDPIARTVQAEGFRILDSMDAGIAVALITSATSARNLMRSRRNTMARFPRVTRVSMRNQSNAVRLIPRLWPPYLSLV